MTARICTSQLVATIMLSKQCLSHTALSVANRPHIHSSCVPVAIFLSSGPLQQRRCAAMDGGGFGR